MQYTVCKKQFLLNSKTFVVFLSENNLILLRNIVFLHESTGLKLMK